MPTTVNFPTIVQAALAIFGDLFDIEPARRHFAEYLTGLIVAENKTASGINREFVLTTEPPRSLRHCQRRRAREKLGGDTGEW